MWILLWKLKKSFYQFSLIPSLGVRTSGSESVFWSRISWNAANDGVGVAVMKLSTGMLKFVGVEMWGEMGFKVGDAGGWSQSVWILTRKVKTL